MLNISKSSDYIPNRIISSFDSTYDQFQKIPEINNFYLKKRFLYSFHISKLYDKHFLEQKSKNDFTIMLNISRSSDYIPNLIISSFDSTYDQFQMISEFFNFYLEQCLSYNFHI